MVVFDVAWLVTPLANYYTDGDINHVTNRGVYKGPGIKIQALLISTIFVRSVCLTFIIKFVDPGVVD